MHKIEPDRGGFRFSVDRLAAPAPDLVRGAVRGPPRAALPAGTFSTEIHIKPTEKFYDAGR